MSMTTQITMTKTLNGTRIEVQGNNTEKVTQVLEAACKAVQESDIPPTEVTQSSLGTRNA